MLGGSGISEKKFNLELNKKKAASYKLQAPSSKLDSD